MKAHGAFTAYFNCINWVRLKCEDVGTEHKLGWKIESTNKCVV